MGNKILRKFIISVIMALATMSKHRKLETNKKPDIGNIFILDQ